jgi:hypothetical protein
MSQYGLIRQQPGAQSEGDVGETWEHAVGSSCGELLVDTKHAYVAMAAVRAVSLVGPYLPVRVLARMPLFSWPSTVGPGKDGR